MSFEARFIPASGKEVAATLGFGFMDARGWSATGCAQAIYAVNTAREWTHFSSRLNLLSDTESLALLVRMQHINGKINGILEFRDIKVAARQSGQFPAYAGVSSYASKSADGKKVYLIVFNRTYDRTVPVSIELKGGSFSEVVAERLYQDNIATVKDFPPQQQKLKVGGKTLPWELPPHSMTAFEFQN